MKAATSIEKVARVLAIFRDRPVVGVRELARKAGLAPSDAHRIVASLNELGFLEQGEARKYTLGLELVKLGYSAHYYSDMCRQARPFLQRLSEMAELTANLAVLDRRELKVVFVEQIDSLELMEIQNQIGSEASPYSTSVGKLLFAYLDGSTAAPRLKSLRLERKTSHSIADLRALDRELAKVRLQGYAVDHEETVEGICCIGAPLFDGNGQVMAAISASVPAARLDESSEPLLITAVKVTAAKLSRALVAHGQGVIGNQTSPKPHGATDGRAAHAEPMKMAAGK